MDVLVHGYLSQPSTYNQLRQNGFIFVCWKSCHYRCRTAIQVSQVLESMIVIFILVFWYTPDKYLSSKGVK